MVEGFTRSSASTWPFMVSRNDALILQPFLRPTESSAPTSIPFSVGHGDPP